MKKDIHPQQQEATIECSCGYTLQTHSSRAEKIHVEICSNCHPFFTGKQRFVDTAGRIDKFRRKYGQSYGQSE